MDDGTGGIKLVVFQQPAALCMALAPRTLPSLNSPSGLLVRLGHRLRPSSVHAGHSRELLRHHPTSLDKLRWVKGRVDEEAAVGEAARRDARGNGVADVAAIQGCARLANPPT